VEAINHYVTEKTVFKEIVDDGRYIDLT